MEGQNHTAEFKPCPFCGCHPELNRLQFIRCSNKDCIMRDMSGMVASSWNTRSTPAQPDKAEVVGRTPSWIENVARAMEKIRGDYISNKRGLGLQGYDYIDAMKAALSALPPQAESGLVKELAAENQRLTKLLNTPEIIDFAKAVQLEAAHQRERWGSEHDAGKAPADWFWLVGYLAGKALHSQTSGNTEKALHHVITTAAALCNWHAAILGQTNMRPGIEEPPEYAETKQAAEAV